MENIKNKKTDTTKEHIIFMNNKNGNIGRTNNFLGRDRILDSLREAVADGKKKIVQLTGVEGIGKSEILRQLFSEYSENYAMYCNEKDKGVFPVFLNYEYNMDDTLARDFIIPQDMKYADGMVSIWQFLKELSEEKEIVLFVDGVNKTTLQDMSLLKLYEINCVCIINSTENVFLNGNDILRIRVGSMDETTALDFFLSEYGLELYDKDLEDAAYIIKELADFHTLTVKLLAALARINRWEISELLYYLERKRFKMSSIYLYSEDWDPVVKEYHKILEGFALKDSFKIVMEGFSILAKDEYSLRFSYDWINEDCKEDNFGQVLETLCEMKLIEESEELMYSIHTLIASTILRTTVPNYDKHKGMIQKSKLALEENLDLNNDERYPFFRIAEKIVIELYDEDRKELADLADKTGMAFLKRSEYERARSQFRRAVVIYENIYGRNHGLTAKAYCNLAKTYERTAEFESALTHYHIAIEIFEEVSGEQDEDAISDIYFSIAGIMRRQGRYDNSLQYYTKSLEMKLKNQDKERLEMADIYFAMAGVIEDIGNFEKTITYLQIASGIREKHLGINHPATIYLYGAMATCFRKKGEYQESLKYYRKTIELYEKEMGKDTLYLSHAYNGIAGVYARMGKFSKARQCCFRSIEISEQSFGKYSMAMATSYYNLALVYREENEYEKSEKYFACALGILEKTMGKESLSAAYIYKGLGGLYKKMYQFEKSYHCYQRVLEIRKKRLGETHPQVSLAKNLLLTAKETLNKNRVVKIADE